MTEKSQTTPPIPPVLVIALGIIAVSTASIFIRYAQAHASSLVIAAYRLSFAVLVLAPIAWRRHKSEFRRLDRKSYQLGILSGLFLALHFATWISSLEYTTVTSSVAIVTTSPLWVAMLSPLVLREPIRRPVIIGLVIALLGGLVIALSETCSITTAGYTCTPFSQFVQGNSFLGNTLALIGALAGAGYLLIGRRLRAQLSLIPYITLVYGIAAAGLIVVMFAFGESPFGYPPIAYVWFLCLALIPQLLGHSSFNWALGYLPAAFVSITLLGEPIGSSILAYFILREIPTTLELIGAILILIGIYFASSGGKARKKRS